MFLLLFSWVALGEDLILGSESQPNKINNVSSSRKNTTTPSTVTSTIDCQELSPCFIVKDTSEQVLNAINNGASQKQTMNLIKNVVTPQFNFLLMTRLALGNNWKQATEQQQQQLVENFKQLLIFTYSSALSKFKGAKISITSQNTTDKKSAVISQVILPNTSGNNQPIKVEYDLAKTSEELPWKAYDIKIENASLVTTYRNQFNEIIQTSKIDGLIKQLETKVTTLQKGKAHS